MIVLAPWLLGSCDRDAVEADPEPLPASCDAGDAAWVQRLFPFILGRRPHGAEEIRLWTAEVERLGRPAVVNALLEDPTFVTTWTAFLNDAIRASRTGRDSDYVCFSTPLLTEHDGALTGWIHDHAPDAEPFPTPFAMADVVADAIAVDDLSALYQTNVFAHTNYAPYCMNTIDLDIVETQHRVWFGDDLLDVFAGRNLTCLGCHNSEWSLTDDPDPALDRSWSTEAPFEIALFGASTGPDDRDAFYAMFRYAYVVEHTHLWHDASYPETPWGWDRACGGFARMPPEDDFLGIDAGWFGAEYGAQGSLWDIERVFAEGVATLEAEPDPTLGTLDAGRAFAWLTAQNLSDQVWKAAFGSRLTLPHGLSRNEAQRDRLFELTSTFVTSGWSLKSLVAAVAMDPLLNVGLPETCGAQSYGLPAVVDPFTADDPDPELQGNGPGDLVHRHAARVLLNGTLEAIEQPPLADWFGTDYLENIVSPDEALLRAVGAYLNAGERGFDGVDFEGLLTWESRFATCGDPHAATGLVPRATALAAAEGRTVEELALAIRDRLLARAAWDAGERELVEDLLGVGMDTPVADVAADPTFLRSLGLFCGALTLSPARHLTIEPAPVGPAPALDLGTAADCAHLEDLLAAAALPAAGCDRTSP